MLLSVTASAAAPAVEVESFVRYVGTATARHSVRFMYREEHYLKYQDARLASRVVLYTCGDGKAFARKTVEYRYLEAPDYAFEDASNGMREGVRSDGDVRLMWFRPNRLEPERSALVPKLTGLVIDAGFDQFIRAEWPALLSGTPKSLPFLVPSRLQSMPFVIEHLSRAPTQPPNAESFRLKLGGVLGWLLPGVDVAYDTKDKMLVSYDGLSNLRDRSGDNFQVHIEFPEAERVASNAAAIEAARTRPLSACTAPR